MKLLALFCLNVLVVNLIAGIILKDQYDDPVVRIAQLHYGDYKYQVVRKIGIPTVKDSTRWLYQYDGRNSLVINWNEQRLSYARADFLKPMPFYLLGVSDKVILMESNKNWARVGIPESGHQFEINSMGAVLSLEVGAPWKLHKKTTKVSSSSRKRQGDFQ